MWGGRVKEDLIMDNQEPKPCPFCGDNPVSAIIQGYDGSRLMHIYCANPLCRENPGTDYARLYDAAVAAWNSIVEPNAK